MARATGSEYIRSPYPRRLARSGTTTTAAPVQTGEVYGGRIAELRGSEAQIRANLAAEIERLSVLQKRYQEKYQEARQNPRKYDRNKRRAYSKRAREYGQRIAAIQSFSQNLNKQSLTTTSSRARVYQAITGSDDYDKAKRKAAYTFAERQERAGKIAGEKYEATAISKASGLSTPEVQALSRQSYAKVQAQYYAGNLRRANTERAELPAVMIRTPDGQMEKQTFSVSGVTYSGSPQYVQKKVLQTKVTALNERFALGSRIEAERQQPQAPISGYAAGEPVYLKLGNDGLQKDILTSTKAGFARSGYELTKGDIQTLTAGGNQIRDVSRIIPPQIIYNKPQNIIKDRPTPISEKPMLVTPRIGNSLNRFDIGTKANIKQGFLSAFSDTGAYKDVELTKEYGARSFAHTAGSFGGYVGKGLVVTASLYGLPQAAGILKYAPNLVKTRLGGYAFAIASGLTTYKATEQFVSAPLAESGLNPQQSDLYARYGKGAISSGTKNENFFSNIIPLNVVRGLDKAKVRDYAAAQGLNPYEARELYTAANRVYTSRVIPQAASVLTVSTATEFAGNIQIGYQLTTKKGIFEGVKSGAGYLSTKVGINSAILGGAEGWTMYAVNSRANQKPITITGSLYATGAGAVSAGALGKLIAYKSITQPKVGKGILYTAYAGDWGEVFGDVLAQAPLQASGFPLAAAIIPKVKSTGAMAVFSFVPTPTNTFAPSPAYATIPPLKTRSYTPSPTSRGRSVPTLTTPLSPAAILNPRQVSLAPTSGFRRSPSLSGRSPINTLPAALTPSFTPVPSLTPSTVPALTPAYTPSLTPTTTTTRTPTLVPTFVPSLTPSLTPTTTYTPTFTPTTVPTTTFQFPFFPLGGLKQPSKRGKAYISSRRYGYSADLPSIDLGIGGGLGKMPKGGFLGLEARPLLGKPRKKRATKKKAKRKTTKKRKR